MSVALGSELWGWVKAEALRPRASVRERARSLTLLCRAAAVTNF